MAGKDVKGASSDPVAKHDSSGAIETKSLSETPVAAEKHAPTVNLAVKRDPSGDPGGMTS